MASLNTYNTRILLTRLVMIVVLPHFYCIETIHSSLNLTKLGARNLNYARDKMRQPSKCRLISSNSGLEAFSRNPTDGSFGVSAFQLAAFTAYLTEVLLSY